MVQVRWPSAGQAYYRRKLAEGKSPKEAPRCLKRAVARQLFKLLQHHDRPDMEVVQVA